MPPVPDPDRGYYAVFALFAWTIDVVIVATAIGIVATGGAHSPAGWGVFVLYLLVGLALGALGIRAWRRR